MSTQTSPDFERLSAYIDNQLSPADKAELEARLARDPELQAGLNDLRRTVRALRSLPPVKPPRSFTLTPEQAGMRAGRGPLFPVLRLAAALCTLLLVVAVARDFTTSGAGASATSNFTTQSGSAATAPVLPHAAPLLSPTPESSTDSYGVSAPAGGAASPTSTASAETATTPMARMNVAAPSATPTGGARAPEGTPEVTIKSSAPSDTPSASDTAAIETSAATAVSVAALPPSATETTTAPTAAPLPPAPGASSLRLAEIVLAALALVFAAATWLTRRG